MNEFDVWQKALRKIDLSEATQFVSRGRLITESDQVDAYNKVQKILACDEMESCHKFLYGIDPTALSQDEENKINKLYKLGCDRGFIQKPAEPEDADTNMDDVSQQQTQQQDDISSQPYSNFVSQQTVPQTAYTVCYSAMKDGTVKTGEAYSNALNTRSAKADILSKLERAGYSNINILCIEVGDPDAAEAPNTYCAQPIRQTVEADDRELVSHALNPYMKASTANLVQKDTAAFSVVEKEDDKDDSSSDSSKKDTETKDADSKDDAKEDTAKKEDKDSSQKDDDVKKDSKKEPEDKDSSDDEDDEEAVSSDTIDNVDSDKDDNEDSDSKADDKSEVKDEESKDEDSEKDDKKDSEDLTDAKKVELKDNYKKMFRATMLKCDFVDKCFQDLTLDEKIKFFTQLSKDWGSSKTDPKEFMTDKEIEQLEKIVVKR